MKLTMMILAAALGFGLPGCAMHGSMTADAHPPGADGVWCGTPGVKGPVYIEIQYAGDGTPSAVPSMCTVAANTDITWRGPNGDLIPFEIIFPGASPAWRDERSRLMSSAAEGRYKVKIRSGDKAGTYKYGIKANDKEIDPAIIIR